MFIRKISMINKPVLARCDNREIKAKKHPSSGNPEEWLDNSYLVAHGLRGVSFDFFVNWEKLSISAPCTLFSGVQK